MIRPSMCTPPPQKSLAINSFWRPPPTLEVKSTVGDPGLTRVADLLKVQVRTASHRPDLTAGVDPNLDLPAEGYRLRVDERGVALWGKDEAGLFYGWRTLSQWLALHDGNKAIQGVEMEDWPHFPNRGVMLDVSRCKVPTMETLRQLIDHFADLKINQVQLYMEHTFAYQGHEQVWKNADPLSGPEIRELDAYCRERFVELVPNQNSFGHFHRWLIHQPYRALAECPEGVEHPFSRDIEPFSLCPTDPGSLALLEDLYGQLLPHFSSRILNTGLDETLDLGTGRSKTQCDDLGKEEVYLQFLEKVHGLAASHGSRMQFWGDIIIKRPDLIPSLPEDAIALEWGYEADHPFAEHAGLFAASGLDFYVCPGTSSWSSILGRVHNARANLASAAKHGKAFGASGYLITDWGDFGHLQPLPVSWPGWVTGAAYAWNPDQAFSEQDLYRALDRWIFEDPSQTMGQALCNLGDVYLKGNAPATNGSALFFLLRFADQTPQHPRLAGLTGEGVARMAARLQELGQPWRNISFKDDDVTGAELDWAVDLAQWTCSFGTARFEHAPQGTVSQLPTALRTGLARDLRELLEAYESLWLKRFRRGGLDLSRKQLTFVLDLLRS